MASILSLTIAGSHLITVNASVIDGYAEQLDSNEEMMLDSYFSKRAENFYGTTSEQGWIAEDQQQRIAALELWERSCEFHVENANVSFVVNDVTENDSETIITGSEWNELEYRFDYEDFSRTMQFETAHVIHISGLTNEITSDCYSEYTGYSNEGTYGSAEEIALVEIGEDVAEVTNAGGTVYEGQNEEAALNYSYSPSAAVSYSESWWSGFNPRFYNYNATDCCNFVSQCLYAGGMNMTSAWSAQFNTTSTSQYDGAFSRSSMAWMSTEDFKNYWVSQGRYCTKVENLSQVGSGNPIFWIAGEFTTTSGIKKTYGTYHNMLIVGAQSDTCVLVNAHSKAAYHMPISLTTEYLFTLWF